MRKLIIGIVALLSFVLLSFNYENMFGVPLRYLEDSKQVKATIYKPYKKNNITASGYRFKNRLSDTTKIIAVSRDMMKKYPFGSKVLVMGVGSLTGIYTVRDLTSKRFKNRIDILVPTKYKNISFDKAVIMKIDGSYFKS